MDRTRYSFIAHGNLPVWNPLSATHLQTYLRQLALNRSSRVLDIGCGRGNLLQLVVTQFDASGVGVDSSSYAIRQAANDLAEPIAAGRLSLVDRAFHASEFPNASFDLILCVGSTHACGGFVETLRIARRLLRDGGMLLVGEGYWKRTPSDEYLSFLKANANSHLTHEGNKETCAIEGFEIVDCSECSQVEWDDYERQYALNVEEYVRANPTDPDASAMVEQIRAWQSMYWRHGRETLGFGMYLLRLRRNESDR